MTSSTKPGRTSNILWFVLFIAIGWLILWTRIYHQTFWSAKGDPIRNSLEFIANMGLTSTMGLMLSAFWDKKRSVYRIAFLITLGLNAIFFFLNDTDIISLHFLSSFFRWWLAAFMGGLLATWIKKGFWENNAPPSEKIETEVIGLHQQHMDTINQMWAKRIFDIILSLVSLTISLPVWLMITFLIWWEDPGPILFVKNSVKRGGENFKQLKFRSMVIDAEKDTGPISGYECDDRVLLIGKFIRKTALDELPQLINILRGDMSYVGPRPQRTVLVHGYIQNLPQYANRHRVRPGLAGLAQVVDSYHISPEEKLAWDLEYIKRAKMWFDLKIVLCAFLLVFVLRFHSDRSPEMTIRKLLNIEKPILKMGHSQAPPRLPL
jgi:lipopolysaccharide/colanic/teichoic acid biosynthesis glycosyltransferase